MQAIMLAAGMGRRLGKHTVLNTKCMVRVAGRTLLERAVEALKVAGIRRLVLVIGYQAENLRSYVQDHIHGMEVTFVENRDYATTNNIYSLWLAREHLAADDTVLLESDTIFDATLIRDLVECPSSDAAVVAKYEQWMDGTVTLLDEGRRIVEFVEKKNFAFSRAGEYYKTVNIYKFSREFTCGHYLPFLEAYIRAYGQNEYYEQVLKAIAHLAQSGLKAHVISGHKWYEVDDAQDLDIAEAMFADDAHALARYQERYGGYWRFPGLLDFCYLVNPYFPPTEFVEKLKYFFETLLTQYPSGLYVQNLNAGRMFDVDDSEIVVGNGAAELIGALGRLAAGTLVLPVPTFNEYARCFSACSISKINTGRTGHRLKKTDLFQAAEKADWVVVINPDNPSGSLIGKDDLLDVVQYCAERGTKVVLDESFLDFAEPGEGYSLFTTECLQRHRNLIVIKSISKSYGVPGLRLGILASADRDLMAKLRQALPVWNINSFAEYFLQVFPLFQREYRQACDRVRGARSRLRRELETIPFIKVYPSHANYFLCELDPAQQRATELAEQLLVRHGILVKDLTGKEGLEKGQFIRVAVRSDADNQRLVAALKGMA